MKTITITIALMMISLSVFAQQNSQYNHYIFNQLGINPAYAGTKGMFNINGIYSTQWTGLKGAPSTQTIGIEGPATQNVGVGLNFVRDNIGAQSQTSIYGNYSFKFRLGSRLMLSLGLATGVSYHTIDGSQLSDDTGVDPAIPLSMETVTRFDSKVGLFLYGKKFYFGFSVSDLTSSIKSSYELLVAGDIKHYYVTGGYVFTLGENLIFKPGFLIKEDFRAPTNIDLNAFLLYKKRIWVGATYRTGAQIFNGKDLDMTLQARDAVVVMTDVNITDNIRLGYAYTITLSALKNYGSHEISLGYNFKPRKESRMLTPRYF